MGYGEGEGGDIIGTAGYANSNDKLVYGIYGVAEGFGSGGWYSVYGHSFEQGDSCYAGYFTGNLVYTGSLYSMSDRMFKANIKPCDGALEKILALEPKIFTYTGERAASSIALPRGEHYGLVAQEVEEILPELVGDLLHPGRPALKADDAKEESFGYKGINYIELIPVLVQAIKEQQETISAYKKTIDDLRARVEALDRR